MPANDSIDIAPYRLLTGADQLTERRLRRIIQIARQRQRGLMLIMEDVHNPHNLAAIARSCDAFGVQNLAFTLENNELFDPQHTGKITSASASKWLDYRIFENGTQPALTTLKNEGWHIMATDLMPGARSLYDVDFCAYDRLALMVGNEHAGISPKAREMADSFVKIPMQGMIQSFNVSVAAAIALSEITRQRQTCETDFHLPDDDAEALIADFVLRSLA
jgi:tRNA (guanosine-2'-O-)-methyltransferase